VTPPRSCVRLGQGVIQLIEVHGLSISALSMPTSILQRPASQSQTSHVWALLPRAAIIGLPSGVGPMDDEESDPAAVPNPSTDAIAESGAQREHAFGNRARVPCTPG
jgi:hypothetical protein